ncbi:MAG TPA: hypothetical protein VHR66_07420 [Gemmataceae bacterium]|nr:hypothetical protein [Gemmataceae bacterium]
MTRDFYSSDHAATETDVLGVMIAVHFGWNGLAVLKTAAAALEDANFHDESAQVQQMLRRLRGARSTSETFDSTSPKAP